MSSGHSGISRGKRFRVLLRDDFTCQYCGAQAPAVRLEVDHMLPVSRGGTDDELNLITSCHDCNQGKRAAHDTRRLAEFRDAVRAMEADYLYAIRRIADLEDTLEETRS